jgi:fructose/tagatose bisphosphate aldolase
MLIDLKQILAIGEDRKCAIPAFNVYNLETAIGVYYAAMETGAPVIFQMYSFCLAIRVQGISLH